MAAAEGRPTEATREHHRRYLDPRPARLQARQERRDAKQRVRGAKADAYESVTPRLQTAWDVARAERKATYSEFVQRRGLYWPTYNVVARSHDATVRQVARARKEGRPAELRHHRYEGTGRIAVQLQRVSGRVARTPALLASPASPWRRVLELPKAAATDPDAWRRMSRSEQRRAGRTMIGVRIGSHPDRTPLMWEISVQVHRPVPPDAEIAEAEVVIRRVAGERRIAVSLALRVATPEPVRGPAVAVDIGWRTMRDGSLRVAYWRGASSPLTPGQVPEHLADVLIVRNQLASGRRRAGENPCGRAPALSRCGGPMQRRSAPRLDRR